MTVVLRIGDGPVRDGDLAQDAKGRPVGGQPHVDARRGGAGAKGRDGPFRRRDHEALGGAIEQYRHEIFGVGVQRRSGRDGGIEKARVAKYATAGEGRCVGREVLERGRRRVHRHARRDVDLPTPQPRLLRAGIVAVAVVAVVAVVAAGGEQDRSDGKGGQRREASAPGNAWPCSRRRSSRAHVSVREQRGAWWMAPKSPTRTVPPPSSRSESAVHRTVERITIAHRAHLRRYDRAAPQVARSQRCREARRLRRLCSARPRSAA